MPTRIEVSPSTYHSLSFSDWDMRLFYWRGKLLRGVRESQGDRTRELFSSGLIPSLVEKRLFVASRVSEYVSDDYPLIIEHESVDRISYPPEWCPQQLKAAALAMLDLEIDLLRSGYVIGDIYPWNVLFRRGAPVFVDLGAIQHFSYDLALLAISQLERFYLFPLRLAALKRWHFVQLLFTDYYRGVTAEDFAILSARNGLIHHTKRAVLEGVAGAQKLLRVLPEGVKSRLRTWRDLRGVATSEEGIRDKFASRMEKLRREIERIELDDDNPWTSYYEDFSQHGSSFEDRDDWNLKQQNIFDVLQELQPRSVMDLCSNRGWYGFLAEELGAEVVLADMVPDVVNQQFLQVSRQNSNVTPVVMDFRYPSPGIGVANGWFAPATERLKCELVMCLAAIHHLVFSNWLSFDQVVAGLDSFSTRWVLAEFIPREDETAGMLCKDGNSWYTEENFIKALEERFVILKRLPSYEPPRLLFLCEKK